MINPARLNELADYIEAHSEIPFDLGSIAVAYNCGTPACIAGFGAALWPDTQNPNGHMCMANVAKKLGLVWLRVFTRNESSPGGVRLMTFDTVKNIAPKNADGWQEEQNYVEPTREDAVAALRAMASGDIDPNKFRWDNFIDDRRAAAEASHA